MMIGWMSSTTSQSEVSQAIRFPSSQPTHIMNSNKNYKISRYNIKKQVNYVMFH